MTASDPTPKPPSAPGDAAVPPGSDGAGEPVAAIQPLPVRSEAEARPRPQFWGRLAVDLFLAALIVVGLVFRFSWTNWSQDTDLHPDEYGLTSTLTRLSVPESFGDYLNTRLSPISPYQKYDENGSPTVPGPDNRMRWGQWPIVMLRWAAEVTGETGYREQRLLGRQLSALADSLALLVLFFIGRRLYGYRVGLLAAALSALAVMQIQQSHFMTADNFAVLFTALAMYCAVRVATPDRRPYLQSPDDGEAAQTPPADLSWLWYALFGLTFGLAFASRINLLPLAGMILVAAVIANYDRWGQGDLTVHLRDVGLRLALAAAVGVVTFRLAHPMAFRAETGDTTLLTFRFNPDWVESMKVAQAESSGIGGGPPGEQWTNRPALVFPFVNMVLWGMGLPLGLATWAGFAWALWRTFKDGEAWRQHILPLGWAGGYFLFMGTRWVMSVRYFLPIYPFLALLAAWALLELWKKSNLHSPIPNLQSPPSALRLASAALFGFVTLGALAWAWGFTSIYRRDNTRIQASRWIYQNVPAPFNLHIFTGETTAVEPLPFPESAPIGGDGAVRLPFTPRVTGTVSGLTLGHARSVNGVTIPAVLHVVLASGDDDEPLAEADVRIQSTGTDPRGETFSVPLGPVAVEKGVNYSLLISAVEGGPVQVAGSIVTNENWDEGLPMRMDGRDAFGGLYRGLEMSVRWGDNEDKRQMFLRNLAEADFIFLPSQRGLWSASRLPNTYPLTMEYYRALFDGRLGFELAAQFQSPITLGPLQISDVAGTWAWGEPPPLPPPQSYPFNDNLLAAEEAFSVYDHAPVWIFKKRADFDLERARAVLLAVDLSTVVNQGPREATTAPTLLMLPADRLAEQRAGGTWSEMFNPDGLLNTVQPLGVLVWWLAVLVIGWLAFPLTYAAFGGLPDRGYALAKTVALLVVAWLVWMAGSFRLLPFTRSTIALGFLVLAVASFALYWPRREEFAAYVRAHWRHLLTVESLFLALFVFDLLIRLGNPDLWHPWKGGEKPMDFSYFNAVLKSTYFPPYDPWLAGGYINYYYYGFVIVGLLVKLLGIVPAFAYNLILPMLFALLGINAFGVAYNLVAARQEEPALPSDSQSPVSSLPPPTRPNPYLAGVAAALLIVVLGNLAQVEFLGRAVQRAADHTRLASSIFGDSEVAVTLNGLWRVVTRQADISVSVDSWYWDASRVVAHRIGERHGNEITEFPFFTFLYADLHAHMIDLPFTVLALAWAAAYVLGAARGRSRGESVAMWLIGGLAFGVTRPTNTWDYPLYFALGAVTVVAGQWFRGPRLTRSNLWGAAWRLMLFAGLVTALYYPYDQWFGSGYTSAELWKGAKTPLDAYLYVHGLFLFVLVTFMAWEARRWLAETPAAILAEADEWLPALLLAVAAFVLALGVFLYLQVITIVISLPLMVWAGLLLLRARASMPPAKRVVLFLLGTGLALTLFVEVVVLKGDIGRQNTIFKFYLQVWTLFSVAAGAALAWVWSALPEWKPAWRGAWTSGLMVLVAVAALYTVTASGAKARDRFPSFAAIPNSGCQPIPGLAIPYADNRGLPVEEQPRSLNGLDFMRWTAYCDRTYFLPLVYDYEAIRWLQDNVAGSPVIVEAQSFDLYRLSSRYAWNTGLPNVVGWDWHQRQQRAALPTDFIYRRGVEVSQFYENPDPESARAFLHKYDVRYVIVGPMERAYYPPEGLAKFEQWVSQGEMTVAYRNPGVTIYAVAASLASGH